jgi:hypothetical protein
MMRSRWNGVLMPVAVAVVLAGVAAAAPVAAQARSQAAPATATPQRPAPARPAPAGPTPAPAPAPVPASAGAAAPAPDAITNPCDYFDPAEVSAVVGTDANQTTAPSRASFVSCGYTSANGDAVTISVADYGLAEVAQTFFDRGRDALKTAVVDDTIGVPAYTNRTPEQPPRVTLAALKGTRIVSLEAAGPLATSPQAAPHLKMILTKAIAKLPVDPPPAPPQD